MRRVFPLFLGVLVAGACGESAAPVAPGLEAPEVSADVRGGFGPAASATYTVTITNLTTGQPFTPPLAATHRKPVSMFTVGEPASFGLKEIAENGNLEPMAERLAGLGLPATEQKDRNYFRSIYFRDPDGVWSGDAGAILSAGALNEYSQYLPFSRAFFTPSTYADVVTTTPSLEIASPVDGEMVGDADPSPELDPRADAHAA